MKVIRISRRDREDIVRICAKCFYNLLYNFLLNITVYLLYTCILTNCKIDFD